MRSMDLSVDRRDGKHDGSHGCSKLFRRSPFYKVRSVLRTTIFIPIIFFGEIQIKSFYIIESATGRSGEFRLLERLLRSLILADRSFGSVAIYGCRMITGRIKMPEINIISVHFSIRPNPKYSPIHLLIYVVWQLV